MGALHRAALAVVPGLDAEALEVRPLVNPDFKGAVADATSKSFIRRRGSDAPWAVMIMSTPAAPDAVAAAVGRTMDVVDALGSHLGVVALRPIWSGEHQGCSAALWPYHQPVSQSNGPGGRLERARMAFRVERWLQDVARVAQRTAIGDQLEAAYLEPLDYVAGSGLFTDEMHDHAARARDQFRQGALRPVTVPAHNDLWFGNVLHVDGPEGTYRFRLIDWGGARVDGYPFTDLVRFFGGTRLTSMFLGRSLRQMARSLGVPDAAVSSYALAALGRLGLGRGDFPLERYQFLGRSQYDTIVRSLGR